LLNALIYFLSNETTYYLLFLNYLEISDLLAKNIVTAYFVVFLVA